MIHKIYSVFDTKAEMHNSPMFVTTEAFAIRSFEDAVKDTNTVFGRHPEDFILYYIGEYDDETGTITQDHIKSVINGINLIGENKT